MTWPNHAFERTAASALRLLAVPSSLRSSAAAQRERYVCAPRTAASVGMSSWRCPASGGGTCHHTAAVMLSFTASFSAVRLGHGRRRAQGYPLSARLWQASHQRAYRLPRSSRFAQRRHNITFDPTPVIVA